MFPTLTTRKRRSVVVPLLLGAVLGIAFPLGALQLIVTQSRPTSPAPIEARQPAASTSAAR